MRRPRSWIVLACLVGLPLLLLALLVIMLAKTVSQPSPSRRRRSSRASASGAATQPTTTLLDDAAPVSTPMRTSRRRALIIAAGVTLAVTALVASVLLGVAHAPAQLVMAGYEQAFALRIVVFFILLPTILVGLIADLVRATTRRRQFILRGAQPRTVP